MVTIDQNKLRHLITRGTRPVSTDELRREGNVFFVGGNLPERETLETLFDSHCQAPAELFHLTFGDINNFHRGEALARVIKKNFNAHLVGRLDYPPPPYLIERAYAAGVDILDIPLTVFDRALSRERGLAMEERLSALDCARSVFPRWSVVSTLVAGEEPPCSTVAGIDALLAAGVVPLVTLSGRAAHYPAEEIAAIFAHLDAGWRKHKVTVKPLLPLAGITTPLADARPKGVLRGFIDKIHDRQLLVTSDLRRSLRVRQVEESFESAGL
ncbi:MAG TPA: hypothetical protein VI298_13865 [Geobacteraceae bacterium]